MRVLGCGFFLISKAYAYLNFCHNKASNGWCATQLICKAFDEKHTLLNCFVDQLNKLQQTQEDVPFAHLVFAGFKSKLIDEKLEGIPF